MTKTVPLMLVILTAWIRTGGTAAADVVVTVRPPFSDPPFVVTTGHSVAYTPTSGVNRTVASGFPQPNTDVEDDNRFGVSPNYGGTGHTALTSRHAFENSPEIALTVGALGDNQPYQVYVQTFVNTGSEFYGGRYGFVSGQLTPYFYSSGGNLIATGNNGPSGQGQFQIREFDLGTQLPSGGQLTFYFDDFDATSRPANFVALRLVPIPIPEPSTIVLAAMGGIIMAGWSLRRLRSRDWNTAQ